MLKRILMLSTLSLALGFGVTHTFVAFAQSADASVPAAAPAVAPVAAAPAPAVVAPAVPPPTADQISQFISMVGGLKGASALAIVAVVVQGIMLLFSSSIGSWAGVYQLLLVNGLTLVGGMIALNLAGQSWSQVLLNSQTLAMLQVFVHQVITQFQSKAADQAAAVASV